MYINYSVEYVSFVLLKAKHNSVPIIQALILLFICASIQKVNWTGIYTCIYAVGVAIQSGQHCLQVNVIVKIVTLKWYTTLCALQL